MQHHLERKEKELDVFDHAMSLERLKKLAIYLI